MSPNQQQQNQHPYQPQRQAQHQQRSHDDACTSPWTEPYQASPQHSDADAHAFDSDAVRPTHDALSDIYNRGY